MAQSSATSERKSLAKESLMSIQTSKEAHPTQPITAIIGLGYVGLPLARALPRPARK